MTICMMLPLRRDPRPTESLDVNAIYRCAATTGAMGDMLMASSKTRFEEIERIDDSHHRARATEQMVQSEELLVRGLQLLRDGYMMLEQSVRYRA